MLNAASLPAYRRELASLLLDAESNRSRSGYPALRRREDAESYVHSLRASLAKGERFLWVISHQNSVVGSIQLEVCNRPGGNNRAEIQQLLIHSRYRRLGAATALLQALEEQAINRQRGLLYLDVPAGSPAEAFYRVRGYRSLGELPDYDCSSDGYGHPAVIYYKRVFALNQVLTSIAS